MFEQSGVAKKQNPKVGDLWFDTKNNQIYFWQGTEWIGVPKNYKERIEEEPTVRETMWACSYCKSLNWSEILHCHHCGAPRKLDSIAVVLENNIAVAIVTHEETAKWVADESQIGVYKMDVIL